MPTSVESLRSEDFGQQVECGNACYFSGLSLQMLLLAAAGTGIWDGHQWLNQAPRPLGSCPVRTPWPCLSIRA